MKFWKNIERIEGGMASVGAGLCLLAMIIITVISVVGRYILQEDILPGAYNLIERVTFPLIVFWAVPSRSAGKYGGRGRDLFALQDATIAASFAWLQAVASGLGACWVGAFDDEAVKSIFREKIERDWRPIALLPIGYAAE